MVKKYNQFFENIFQEMSLAAVISILIFCGCKSKRTENTFILDNIQYELKDGGVGYEVNNDNSFDLNRATFVATLHITNLTKSVINLDTSNFKLIGKDGTPFSLVTKINGMDVSVMYKQSIEPEDAIDYMLTFAVPKDAHYELHVISPISRGEKVIHY